MSVLTYVSIACALAAIACLLLAWCLRSRAMRNTTPTSTVTTYIVPAGANPNAYPVPAGTYPNNGAYYYSAQGGNGNSGRVYSNPGIVGVPFPNQHAVGGTTYGGQPYTVQT